MAKFRAVIIGAGRIGTGWNWSDLEYTHAGAYRALKDRVELVGIADPDAERLNKACDIWNVQGGLTAGKTLEMTRPDIVSICTQPDVEQRETILNYCVTFGVKGIWCEKPWVGLARKIPTQVNYMRRADLTHQRLAKFAQMQDPPMEKTLIAYAKDDIHTRCHFEDLAQWWGATLDYRQFNGPCAYLLKFKTYAGKVHWFDNGGVDPAECMRGMLGNLLDHLQGKADLWSPVPRA